MGLSFEDIAKKAAKAAGVDPNIIKGGEELLDKGKKALEDKKFEAASRVRADQPSELAANLSKFMDEQGVPRGKQKGKDGTLSKNDIKVLHEFLSDLSVNTSELKGEFRLNDKKDVIELTDKALKAIKVEVPAKEKNSAISRAVDVAEIGAPNIGSNGGPRQLG